MHARMKNFMENNKEKEENIDTTYNEKK